MIQLRGLWLVVPLVLLVTGTGCSESEAPAGAGTAGSGGSADDASADHESGGQSGAAGASGAAGTGGAPGEAGSAGSDSGAEDATQDAPQACDPAAAPGSLYELSAVNKATAEPVSLCAYRGKVLLIANVAALCGFTPQMGSLASVQSTYAAQGFAVLGFYCDQFGQQAGSEAQQLACEKSYGVNFDLFSKVNVNPPEEHEVFSWLKSQPGGAGDITWNFEKFLVSRKGALLARWPSAVDPEAPQVAAAIEAALADAP